VIKVYIYIYIYITGLLSLGIPPRRAVLFTETLCGTQNRAVFWPFGKRVMELLILDKKERVAESQ